MLYFWHYATWMREDWEKDLRAMGFEVWKYIDKYICVYSWI